MTLLETFVKLLNKDYGISLRIHQMPLKHQIIMTLMRLKLDLSFTSLAAFFECTSTTCKSIFIDILKHLAVHLKCAIPWLTKEEVLGRMPKCFHLYRNTRLVLDCTEVRVTKTDCGRCRILTYSQYKSNHTIKLMFGVSPGGIITFISPVYGGRASDKEIFKQSEVVQCVEPHEDAIMVDKGFNIDDICAENFIEIYRPPFLRQKKKFSGTQATTNTSIARARVHVERMIQRVKVFKIFQGPIPWAMLPFINEMFIVCSGIANLGNPILGDDKF